jgi:hypothetical protein
MDSDVLVAQATAVVPCERVFSSSKETCTLRCSQLGPTTIEILKYLYQRERLNFTTGILRLAMEEDYYTIEGPFTESAVFEPLKAGKEE